MRESCPEQTLPQTIRTVFVRLMALFARRFAAQKVVGVDPSPSSGQLSQSRLRRQGGVQCLVLSPTGELPFSPEMYLDYLDTVIQGIPVDIALWGMAVQPNWTKSRTFTWRLRLAL